MKNVVVAIAVLALAGCAQQPPPRVVQSASQSDWGYTPRVVTYNPDRSPALNFASAIDTLTFSCKTIADMSYSNHQSRRQMGLPVSSNEGNDLEACIKNAYKQSDEVVSWVKPPKTTGKIADLSKDAYAKWFDLLKSLSIYRPMDTVAVRNLDSSLSALRTEDKFSK